MIVLDASVAIKWFLREPESPRAVRIAQDMLGGREIGLVPELFYYEVYSVVVRKHENPGLWTREGFAWLSNLPLKRIPMDATLSALMEPFCRAGLTGYDAAYAAVARRYKADWLTFDGRACRLLNGPDWIRSP